MVPDHLIISPTLRLLVLGWYPLFGYYIFFGAVMSSDSEVVLVSATSDSDAWEMVPAQATTPKDQSEAKADAPTTTKAEVKEEEQVIQEEPVVIPDEPDFSPVKDPAHIEPMEVPHEDEDAICHSLAKASLSPLEPPKVKRFVAVPVATPSEDGQPTDLLNKGGGALPINPLRLNIPLDDHAERQDQSEKKDAEPAKTPVEQQGHHDPKLTGNKGAEQTNLMAAPAIPKRSFLRAGLDSTSAGEDASPLLQDFIRPKPKGSTRKPISPPRSRSQRRVREASPARRARDKAAKASKDAPKEPRDKHEFFEQMQDFVDSLEGLAPYNLHVAAYFFQPSARYPLTHPRQLSAVTLRRNSGVEKRWVCWQCSTNAGYERQECYDVYDHACHWWSTHAGDAEWAWWHNAQRFQVTLAEVLQLSGVDLRREPLPLASLKAIPRHIPSHPSGQHDTRLFEHPYNLGVAGSTTISELKLAEWKGQWTITPAASHHQVTRIPVPPAYPPQDQMQEIEDDEETTSFGWVHLIPDYTQNDPEALETVISPASDLHEYCQARREWHYQQCSTRWLTMILLKLEEHAFYLALLKLMATKVLTKFPTKLEESQKAEVLRGLWSYPQDLERRMQRSLAGIRSSSEDLDNYIHAVQNYITAVIKLDIPIANPWSIPRVPGLNKSFGVKLS